MSSEIYNDCTVVRISNNVVYQLTKPIFKVREDWEILLIRDGRRLKQNMMEKR